MIPQVEPVENGTPPSRHFLSNGLPRRPAVNASDHDIDAIHVGARAEMFRHGMPIQTPEKVHARDKDHGLRMSDLSLAEGLAHTIRRRHHVAIHQGHIQRASPYRSLLPQESESS